MKQTMFFRLIALITFLLSCYTWWILYNQQSLWWILLGLMLLVTMLTSIYGLRSVRRFLAVPGLSLPISDFLLTASAIGYFASALVGFVILIFQLPFQDKSFMIFPLIIAILIFGGATLGLYHDQIWLPLIFLFLFLSLLIVYFPHLFKYSIQFAIVILSQA